MPGAPIFQIEVKPRIALLLAAALAVAGCAHGGIRDGVYHAPKGRYTIQVPAGTWERMDVDGADLALTSADRSISILTSTLCGRYRRADLKTLSRSLFVGLVDRRVREEETVKIPAGEARRVVVEGRVSGTNIAAEAYTLRQSRCVFDFVYLAAPDRFGTGVESFRAMIRTLRLADEGSR